MKNLKTGDFQVMITTLWCNSKYNTNTNTNNPKKHINLKTEAAKAIRYIDYSRIRNHDLKELL